MDVGGTIIGGSGIVGIVDGGVGLGFSFGIGCDFRSSNPSSSICSSLSLLLVGLKRLLVEAGA